MRSRWVQKKLACSTNADHRWEQLVGPGKDPVCPVCGGVGIRPDPAAPNSPTVIDDQLEGGAQWIHNLGHDPVWVETKTQLAQEQKARGLRPMVRHIGVPGSDKSPHTVSWNLPSTQDVRPYAFLSPEEKIVRRREAAERLGFTVEQLEAIAAPGSSDVVGVEKPRSACEFYPDRGTPAPAPKSRIIP